MAPTYYLDESGTSGDLAGRSADFGGQPIFVLACIEVKDQADLAHELNKVRRRHRLQGEELKSSQIINKPGVISDLVAYIAANNLPIFAEVVDKRFNVIAYMVTHLLTMPFEPVFLRLRPALAEQLSSLMPDKLIEDYRFACQTQSADSLREVFKGFMAIGDASGDPLLKEALRRFLGASVEDFEDAPTAEAVRRYLPIPDLGKGGHEQWMLPELTSLTNIYGRLNQYHNGRLSDVTLIHDEHAHFGQILTEAMSTCESLVERGMELRLGHADFRFRQRAKLEFGRSHDNPGIQMADVIAGFIMRYTQDMIVKPEMVGDGRKSAFHDILALTVSHRSVGTNFVLPAEPLQQIGIPYEIF